LEIQVISTTKEPVLISESLISSIIPFKNILSFETPFSFEILLLPEIIILISSSLSIAAS